MVTNRVRRKGGKDSAEITDEIIAQAQAASLFSANYSLWGPVAEQKMREEQGRIKMSSSKLKK